MKTPVRRTGAPAAGPRAILVNFPPQFTPRPQQEDAILRIDAAFRAGKRFVVLELPTGGGKSFITQTFARGARVNKQRTHFLTASKILQDQYEKDFPEPEIVTIKGRNAYGCTHHAANPTDSAAYAPCTRRGKGILTACAGDDPEVASAVVSLNAQPYETTCPYWAQLLKANAAPITLFNFSSFLFQQRIGRFGKRELMVVDEAHNIEGQLLNFVELSVTEGQLEPVEAAIPPTIRTAEDVQAWINGGVLDLVQAACMDDDRPFEEIERLQKLAHKLETFLEYIDRTEWIIENVLEDKGRVLRCRPVYAFDFAQDLLFSKAARVLAVSATILDANVWAANLGIDPNDMAFIQMGSDFPVANRPIQRAFAGDMSYKHKNVTMPKLITLIKELLARHAGERGIIHAHSFALAQAIVKGVGSPRLLLHDPGVDKRDVLATHAARADSVIVAPAFHEGIDLKDDLSRFQIIAKVPYPSIADPVIKRRMETAAGRTWYQLLTCLKIVQAYGRSVRSKDDHAVTYVTDAGFAGLVARAGRMLPPWFREALV